MLVRFGSMVIRDFKAFRGKHALALEGEGVVYVVGDNTMAPPSMAGNGASKSSLWDALCWCLYGKTPRGLGNTDIVPWDGGKPSVTVAFDVGGTKYVVQRSTNPNRFTINGKDEPDISEILSVSFELFINTILLPQAVDLFLDKSPTKKMELFTQTLDLERWDLHSSAAKVEVDKLEAELGRIGLDATASSSALDEVFSMLEETKRSSVAWNDDNMSRTQTSKREVEQLKKRFDDVDKKLATAILDEDSALTEYRASGRQAEKLRGDIATLRGTVSNLKGRREALEDQITQGEQQIDELSRARSCPTCGQAVKPSNLAKHKAELAELVAQGRATSKKWTRSITEDERKLTDLRQSLVTVEADIAEFSRKADDAQDRVIRHKTSKLEIETDLQRAQAVPEETNPYLQQIRQLNERRRDIERELREIETLEKVTSEKLEQTRPWVKWFKEIKLQLIRDVLDDWEFAANSMIEEVGLEDWQIRADVEKESKTGNIQRKIDVQISSPESKGFVKWESWSGGENQRLRLVGSLALADVLLNHAGLETNLEILDEPAVYWSSAGVEELCAFLARRAREQRKRVMYVEHQAVESSHFSEVLRVVKTKDGAYIE